MNTGPSSCFDSGVQQYIVYILLYILYNTIKPMKAHLCVNFT